MTRMKINTNSGYTIINNKILREKRLSLKAKGLHTFLTSLPEDWDYTVEGLTKILPEGRDAIRATLNELEAFGYLVRERERDAQGHLIGTIYTIYQDSILEKSESSENSTEISEFNTNLPMTDYPTLDNPTTQNPTLENPTLDNPTQENPTQINKDIQNKELNKLKKEEEVKEEKEKLLLLPSRAEIISYCKSINKWIDIDLFIDWYSSPEHSIPIVDGKLQWKEKVNRWYLRNKAEGKDYSFLADTYLTEKPVRHHQKSENLSDEEMQSILDRIQQTIL